MKKEKRGSPKANTHLYSPLNTNNLLNIRAHEADEQLLFVLKIGMPVKPSSTKRNQNFLP